MGPVALERHMSVLPVISMLSLLCSEEPNRTGNYHTSLQVFLVICYSNFRLENSITFKLHDVNHQLCTSPISLACYVLNLYQIM
jgi:hypothetical protein